MPLHFVSFEVVVVGQPGLENEMSGQMPNVIFRYFPVDLGVGLYIMKFTADSSLPSVSLFNMTQ